jgi:hypothetical protein
VVLPARNHDLPWHFTFVDGVPPRSIRYPFSSAHLARGLPAPHLELGDHFVKRRRQQRRQPPITRQMRQAVTESRQQLRS